MDWELTGSWALCRGKRGVRLLVSYCPRNRSGYIEQIEREAFLLAHIAAALDKVAVEIKGMVDQFGKPPVAEASAVPPETAEKEKPAIEEKPAKEKPTIDKKSEKKLERKPVFKTPRQINPRRRNK